MHVTVNSDTVSRRYLDGMRGDLRSLLDDAFVPDLDVMGFAMVLLRLVELAVEWIEQWKTHALRLAFDWNRSKVKSLLTSTELDIQELEGDPFTKAEFYADVIRLKARQIAAPQAALRAEDVSGWYSVKDNCVGLDLSSVKDTARHLLGESIEDICRRVTHPERCSGTYHQNGRVRNDNLRVLHVEPVIRHDLVARFLRRRDTIHEELLQMPYRDLRRSVDRSRVSYNSREDTIAGLANVLAEPSITFHGAQRHTLASIVRYGFLVPGSDIGSTGTVLNIRSGASYGVGVYSSPDPAVAMNYGDRYYGAALSEGSSVYKVHHTPGLKLLVCATLMGRPATVSRSETRRTTDILVGSAHSHVSPCGSEYIVFDSAQIIPCYILHLDDHPDMRNSDATGDPSTTLGRLDISALRSRNYGMPEAQAGESPIEWAGDVKRRKAAVKASALKYLPYGFGSATGTNFVVEDVADISDDEEIYGDFQEQRTEQGQEIRDRRYVRDTNWFDEYQAVRKTHVDIFCRE